MDCDADIEWCATWEALEWILTVPHTLFVYMCDLVITITIT